MLIQKRKGKKIEKDVRERKRNLIYVEVPILGHCAKNIFCKYALLTKQLMVYLVAQTVKNLPANAGDTRNVCSIPGSGRSLGEGNGNPLQYSFLENPMDRGA